MKVAGLEGFVVAAKRSPQRPRARSIIVLTLSRWNFTALGPDITYVRIPTGFCDTAFITDICTCKIVGWTVAASLLTETLPRQALEDALLSTSAEACGSGLVHLSDRGSQYVSLAKLGALTTAGVEAFVGTVGCSFDSALAETVNGLYKAELSTAIAPGRP